MNVEQVDLARRLVAANAFRWEDGMRRITSLGGSRGIEGEALKTIGTFGPDVPDLAHRPTAALLAVQAMEEIERTEDCPVRLRFCGMRRHYVVGYDHDDERGLIYEETDELGTAAAKALLALKEKT